MTLLNFAQLNFKSMRRCTVHQKKIFLKRAEK